MKRCIQNIIRGFEGTGELRWRDIFGFFAGIILITFAGFAICTVLMNAAAKAEPKPEPADAIRLERSITRTVNAAAAAAARMDMSEDAVRFRDNKVRTAEAAGAFELYLMGGTVGEIAAQIGTRPKTIRDWRWANDLLPHASMHSMQYLRSRIAARITGMVGE